MSIFIGNQEINPAGLSAVYIGQNKVWPTEPPATTCVLSVTNTQPADYPYDIHFEVWDDIQGYQHVTVAQGRTTSDTLQNPFRFKLGGGGLVAEWQGTGGRVSLSKGQTLIRGNTKIVVSDTSVHDLTITSTSPLYIRAGTTSMVIFD